MSEPVPTRSVKHAGLFLRYLVIGETDPDDDSVEMWIADPDDGPSVLLSADQCDEIAADLTARAALIRSRWEVAR